MKSRRQSSTARRTGCSVPSATDVFGGGTPPRGQWKRTADVGSFESVSHIRVKRNTMPPCFRATWLGRGLVSKVYCGNYYNISDGEIGSLSIQTGSRVGGEPDKFGNLFEGAWTIH